MKKQRKKREYLSSELVKSFASIYGFDDKLLALQVKDFLQDYLDEDLFSEIESVNLEKTVLKIRIISPLLKNDFQLRKSFFLKKFQNQFGAEKFTDLLVF